nr:Crp/Fnr family transcriptional regulator [Hydrogenophilus thiooxidans]
MLAALSEEALTRLLAVAQLRSLKRRELAWPAHEQRRWVGWVVCGSVVGVSHTLDGREVALFRCGAGDVFGESELLAGAQDGVTLLWVAGEATTVILAPAEAWRFALAADAPAALAAAERIARQQVRLLWLRQVLAEPSTPLRVAAILRWLAEEGEVAAVAGFDNGRWLPPGVTQQEVAAYANTTRETVTRVMQRLQAEGIAVRSSAGWAVDVARLRRWQPG